MSLSSPSFPVTVAFLKPSPLPHVLVPTLFLIVSHTPNQIAFLLPLPFGSYLLGSICHGLGDLLTQLCQAAWAGRR